ncbi:MAG: dihydrolipoamide acetyltransferase family protein [Chloroflexota bacterium]
MPVPFIMPKFDMDQEKATIISWLKHEGDYINLGETVLTVETEKVAIDVPSPATGTLTKILYKEGDVVPVTEVIAYVLMDGESSTEIEAIISTLPSQPEKAHLNSQEKSTHLTPPTGLIKATPVAKRMANEEGLDISKISPLGEKIKRADVERFIANKEPIKRVTIPATPAARRLARENGIVLETIKGSGPRGRIQQDDVQEIVRSISSQKTEINDLEADMLPLTSIQRTIAERMQLSFHEAPHIALTVSVDVTDAEDARNYFNDLAEKQGKPRVTLTALLVKIVGWALVRNPLLNSSYYKDSIRLWKVVNIGVATATPQGLVVPVIKGVDHMSVSEINSILIDLTNRARENKLNLEDVRGGTFTISNLGMFGIDQFRAIINPPESAILAVGRIVRRPVVVDNQDRIEVRPILTLTLSADHRVIDGIVAARFLNDLVSGIEKPSFLLY